SANGAAANQETVIPLPHGRGSDGSCDASVGAATVRERLCFCRNMKCLQRTLLLLAPCLWLAGTAGAPDNVTLPFTRMFLGPMDYTPGAMLNATKAGFAQIFDRPMAMGTRCHQLAMYVVFESPLQMLADSPSNYLREPEAMEFLSAVPTVWDETRVLDAKIAEYVVVARRRGKDWYIGAMTN